MARLSPLALVVAVALAAAIVAPSPAMASAECTTTDLGSLGGRVAVANAVNDAGMIVGGAEDATGAMQAFSWNRGLLRRLPAIADAIASEATALNQRGVVVGQVLLSSGTRRAAVWNMGVGQILAGPAQSSSSGATGINSRGIVVGWAEIDGRTWPAWWVGGVGEVLPTLAGGEGAANAINANGTIAGWSTTAAGARRAVVWTALEVRQLGGPDPSPLGTTATAVSDNGVVVGFLGLQDFEHASVGLMWRGDVRTELTAEGWPFSFALGVNNAGTVVGGVYHLNDSNGMAWVAGAAAYLPNLGYDSSSGAEIVRATGTNSRGWISGSIQIDLERDEEGVLIRSEFHPALFVCRVGA